MILAIEMITGIGDQMVISRHPSVKDGLLELKLLNAVDSFYCNTEIYDPTEPYLPGTQVRVRLKCSEIHTGSRGWGFWDGDLDIPSLLFDYDVAWVMQQGSDFNSSDYQLVSFRCRWRFSAE